MKTVRTIGELRRILDRERSAGSSIGFVPTMGALHEGHLSPVRLARVHSDVLVLSIFVNPLQFGPSEDFEAYPRDEEADLKVAEDAGVDLAFLPTVTEMYPATVTTTVHVQGLSDVLEGAHRPGHFDGVATVVAKLFNAVEPDVAVFGEKDAQQVAVIKKLVTDLNFDVEILVGETVREADGLALSSRNVYLSPEERPRAAALYRALTDTAELLRAGESPHDVEPRMRDVLDEYGLQVDYAVAVDPDTFGEPSADRVLLVIAARLGTTRLIDNMLVTRHTGPP